MSLRWAFIEKHAIALSYEKLFIDQLSLETRLVVQNLHIVSTERDNCNMKIVFRSSEDEALFRKKISLGDQALIQEADDSSNYNLNNEVLTEVGVVVEITAHTISFLVHRNCKLNLNGEKYIFEKDPDGIGFDKLAYSLSCLKTPSFAGGEFNLDQIFFEEVPMPPVKPPVRVTFVNESLDDSQKYAAGFALAQEKLCMISGPPGTGKSALIIELLHQLKLEGKRVLVCAPSNVAIDNILERMDKEGFTDMVKLGNTSRTNPKLLKYCSEVIHREKFHKDLYQARSMIQKRIKPNNANQKPSSNNCQSEEDVCDVLSSLRISQPKLEPIPYLRKRTVNTKTPYSDRIRSALDCNFVLGTLIGVSGNGIISHIIQDPSKKYDVIIIDECSQGLEIATWLSLPLAKKAILVGDTKQLPPITLSKEPEAQVFQVSLMDRLLAIPKFLDYQVYLTVQHRMNSKIIEWCSKTFYQGIITSDPNVASLTLKSLSNSLSYPPIILFDSKNCEMSDSNPEDDLSCCNTLESEIVAKYVQFLVNDGIDQSNIGVITPYKQQVKLIRSQIEKYSDIAIKTVDGFQGLERDVIVLSLVRSNPEQRIGFLSDLRRINVALTRPKKHLAVFCDSSTIISNETLETLVDYMYENAKVILLENFSGDSGALRTLFG